MKRFWAFLLALLLLSAAALADPLVLTEDLSNTVTVLYDEADPSAGQYVYSYRFPHADPEDPTAYLVNSFFEYEAGDTESYTIPNLSDYYAGTGQSVTVDVSYTVTCNNSEYFSVLLCKRESVEGSVYEKWTGCTFSRLNGVANAAFSLPCLLGILDPKETDEWLQQRQAGKAVAAVRALAWEAVEDDETGRFYPDLAEEDLTDFFYPEEDFYMNEDGDLVFFAAAGCLAPADAGPVTFTFSVEDIRDEL